MKEIRKGKLFFIIGLAVLVATASLGAWAGKKFKAPKLAAAGAPIEVTYSQPMASAEGDRYWITIIDPAAADSEWGAWVYVEDGATSTTLTAPSTPGKYEIRLHDHYPKKPYHVLERASLLVQ